MNAQAKFFGFTRVYRLIGLALLALGLLAGAAPASASAGSGWLRLAHLSPNTPAVDVYLYSLGNPKALVVVPHVAYGTISQFQKVPAGEYTVAMRLAGAKSSTPAVISQSVDIQDNHAYTVAGMGPAKGLRLAVLKDRLVTPKGKVLVRIIQASLREHQVTIRAGHSVVARDVRFGKYTGYKVVKPGDWKVTATGPTDRTSSTISLQAGTIHTIVVLDDPGHLFLDDLVDAAGSKILPGGAPATGYGGTAPRPGHSDLPWVALAGAGLLIGAAGFRRVRKPIGAHAMSGRGPSAAA
jgi:Domain of unknown function (DUF4397)